MTAVLNPLFKPLRDSYSFIPSNPVVEAKYAGLTKKRYDRLRLHRSHVMSVSWILRTPTQYTQFMGFFRTQLQNGTLAFLMDLVSDIRVPTTHRCRTRGRMPKLTGMKGNTFYVSCELEVDVNPTITGIITYRTPDIITFSKFSPYFSSFFNPGDTIRIIEATGLHPDSDTYLNMDGQYEVASVSQTGVDGELVLTDPDLVNSAWTILAGLSPDEFGGDSTGQILSTVTKVPV